MSEDIDSGRRTASAYGTNMYVIAKITEKIDFCARSAFDCPISLDTSAKSVSYVLRIAKIEEMSYL